MVPEGEGIWFDRHGWLRTVSIDEIYLECHRVAAVADGRIDVAVAVEGVMTVIWPGLKTRLG